MKYYVCFITLKRWKRWSWLLLFWNKTIKLVLHWNYVSYVPENRFFSIKHSIPCLKDKVEFKTLVFSNTEVDVIRFEFWAYCLFVFIAKYSQQKKACFWSQATSNYVTIVVIAHNKQEICFKGKQNLDHFILW